MSSVKVIGNHLSLLVEVQETEECQQSSLNIFCTSEM